MRSAIRARIEAATRRASLPPPVAVDLEQNLLTPKKVGEILAVSADAAKRIFRTVPGTVFLVRSDCRHAQMRIPRPVLKRYIEESMVR